MSHCHKTTVLTVMPHHTFFTRIVNSGAEVIHMYGSLASRHVTSIVSPCLSLLLSCTLPRSSKLGVSSLFLRSALGGGGEGTA